jgi:hypothetical protein
VTVSTLEQASEIQARRRGISSTIRIRALQVLLWVLVVSGPVAALVVSAHLSVLSGRLEVVQGATSAADPPADTAGVEGFAELFIAAYLDAGEGSTTGLDGFVDSVALDGVEAGSWSVVRTTSLGAEEIAPGYFAVTVAVNLIAQPAGGDPTPVPQSVGTFFYSVGVAETDSGWRVVGLPALVPAPTFRR